MALEKPQLQVVATVATHEASIWKTTGKKNKTVLPHFNTPPGCYEINTLYVQIFKSCQTQRSIPMKDVVYHGDSYHPSWFLWVYHGVDFPGFLCIKGKRPPMFTRVSPTSKMSNICMRSCIGTLATFGWLWSLPGSIDWSVRFCFGSPAILVWRTFFLETVGFQKRRYLYKKNMACELHWNLLDMRELIEILLVSSNGFEILWFEQFFFLVPCKNTRDRMTNDRHCQIATKVKAHVETTVPLVVPLGPKPPLYL